MYTRMLVQVRQCKMHKCTMHMHNATTKLRKRREKQTRPTKLTKEKLAIKRGKNPKLPSQASKCVMLKRFGQDICGLPLGRDMDQVYVASLIIVSQEVEPDIYVFGSGVQDRVLCNSNSGHVVYKNGNPIITQSIILQGLFHPKDLGATASSGNILSFCGGKRYASLLARGPRR